MGLQFIETDFCSQKVIGFNGNAKLEDLCKPNGMCKNIKSGAICVCKPTFSGATCKDNIEGTQNNVLCTTLNVNCTM